jgi:hypothetical protein
MGEDGMHTKNAGGSENPLANTPYSVNKFTRGFRGVAHRARLSNAIGYNAKEAPRFPRGIEYRNTRIFNGLSRRSKFSERNQ